MTENQWPQDGSYRTPTATQQTPLRPETTFPPDKLYDLVSLGGRHEYEVVGYVIEGRAELHLEGQTVKLEPGNSWVVPAGARHSYKILEPFKAVEATAPPFQVHGREQ